MKQFLIKYRHTNGTTGIELGRWVVRWGQLESKGCL